MVALTYAETRTLRALKSLDDSPAIDWFSSGLPSLDMILGGGFPKGRVIEVYGPQSSGKTTLALQVAAQAQKQGEVLFIDTEHALSKEYAAAVGVDTKKLLIARPTTAEETLDLARLAIRQKFAMVVIDSIAAMPAEMEMEATMREKFQGVHDHILSEGLKRIVQNMGDQTCTTLFVTNQLRDVVGVIFGSPERTTGGKALGYYASVQLDMRAICTLKRGPEEYGQRIKFKVRKNKIAAPFRICESDLIFGQGFSYVHDLLDHALEIGAVCRRAEFYYLGETELGRGRDAVLDVLKSNSKLLKKVEGAIAKCQKSKK